MDENINPGKMTHAKKLPFSPSVSPVVLVLETPPAQDRIPIATEDEATPTPHMPASPHSYAFVAALPAAHTNAVVWPRNARAASRTPSPPPLGQRPLQATTADELPALDTTGTRSGETLVNSSHEENTSVTLSSLPSSSPIHYTSSASATPAPRPSINIAHSTPRLPAEPDNLNTTSYEESWAQIGTPVLPESNMPSALQTPRLLTQRTNGNPPGGLGLENARATTTGPAGAPAKDENRPPLPSAASHPPVASRLRKRRRGASPISGE
ncbi:hypothetical protein OH76DRAFT_1490967 [Lentinus brumalis]|uniref:Uncharacterized protein n=1 Tax=Lentinus brumalis TaxID=2498619 RepID=A0A371CH55_9APHY|nr:hypothetical protein OH76DRAFT_1490967 [Polyporus brumalis]